MADCLLIILLVLLIILMTRSNCSYFKADKGGDAQDEQESQQMEEPVKETMVAQPRSSQVPQYKTYSDFLLNAGIEKTVMDSHRQFVDEIQHKTTGASTETVRDDDNDVNPRWGLRKTNYFDATAGADARVTSSEDPRQMYQWKPTGLL